MLTQLFVLLLCAIRLETFDVLVGFFRHQGALSPSCSLVASLLLAVFFTSGTKNFTLSISAWVMLSLAVTRRISPGLAVGGRAAVSASDLLSSESGVHPSKNGRSVDETSTSSYSEFWGASGGLTSVTPESSLSDSFEIN